MPRRKKKKSTTDSDGLRVSYPKKRKRKLKEDHWSSDFEDGMEAGFEAAEIFVDAVFAILRMF